MTDHRSVRRTEGGYLARLGTPEDPWIPESPVSRRTIEAKLREFGDHPRDILELLRHVDRAWLVEHPEEPDPDEFVTITKSDKDYSALADRRTGFTIVRDASSTALMDQLVALGFDRLKIAAQLDEIEQLWERDLRTDRRALGSIDVVKRDGGYVWRSFGMAWPDWHPISAEDLRKTFFFIDQSELDAVIDRADREAE